MFERFTDRARKAVTLAQEEARTLSHNYIGTEHVLLGIIREGGGVGAQVLAGSGVSVDDVRAEILERIGRGTTAPKRHIPFTPRAKKVLEFSLKEALQLGHNYIGTEHILLGLIREGEGVAASVLTARGLDLAGVRDRVLEALQAYTARAEAVGAEAAPEARVVEGLRYDEAREGVTRATPEMRGAPACPLCHAALEGSAAYRVVDVPEDKGEGTAQVLFLFCRACGHTLDDLILPDEG